MLDSSTLDARQELRPECRPPLPPEGLAAEAQGEGRPSPRSRLDPCADAIFILREKGWPFAAITRWLGQRGVRAAESTVQRFYRARTRAGQGTQEGHAPQGRVRSSSSASHLPRLSDAFFDASPPHENPPQSPLHGTRVPPAAAPRPRYNTDF